MAVSQVQLPYGKKTPRLDDDKNFKLNLDLRKKKKQTLKTGRHLLY
jgi:hypothetical protein